jgi:hypothetical protein
MVPPGTELLIAATLGVVFWRRRYLAHSTR